MGQIKVGLVQINNSFFNQNYFPYSAGILQAFAQKNLTHPESFEFLSPIYKRIAVDKAVNHLVQADIVGFSIYLWNLRLSLEIAKSLKESRPGILIIFGGPQAPDKAETFLRENEFIDIVCHGEGEIPFLSILENYPSTDVTKISSISCIDENGKYIQNPRCERISNLDEIPSPYLEGIFDDLIESNPEEEWIVLWETNRGCPFSCAFCDWGSATHAKVYPFGIDRLRKEVDWFSSHKLEFIYACDANFGILPRDMEIANYVAANKQKYGYPKALSVQNTKNSTERTFAIQKVLGESGLNKGVTLSLQSMNPRTLKSVNRSNIKNEVFQELQQKFTVDGIETYTDIILGLPNETYETFTGGTSTVIESGQHNRIQFNNLVVLPNSEMGDPAYQRKHGLVIRETKVINLHGSLAEANEVSETQQLVVGTRTMPPEDWVRSRVFSWMTAFLHFDKVLQIPFIILSKTYSLRFRDLIGIFTDGDLSPYPILSEIRQFFVYKATDMQDGGVEYCESKAWLNIWWPADELMMIKLCTEGKLEAFYDEAEKAILAFFRNRSMAVSNSLLRESLFLNRHLIKMPFQDDYLNVKLSHNVWEVYSEALRGRSISLKKGNFIYRIDRSSETWPSWDVWCKEVVWYGNKKGAYLYYLVSANGDGTKNNVHNIAR